MHRTYTMRMKVTRKQDRHLSALLLQLCELYNMALEQRRDAYKTCHISLRSYDQTRELTQLRAAFPEYASMPMRVQRDPLFRLQKAFDGFFRRIHTGERAGYPRFKSHDRYNSFTITAPDFSIGDGSIRLVKLGTFRFKTRCAINGVPKVVHVKRCGNSWVAWVVCFIGDAPEKKPVTNTVGIDVGLTTLATLSDGTEIPNPRWTKDAELELAKANRSFRRKKLGSSNRFKARERLRRIHQSISGRRRAYLHGVSRQLVESYDLIAYEKLRVRNMVRSSFAKSILDAAWSELLFQIGYKAEKAGVWFVPVNPRGTSQMCSGCGAIVKKELSERQHNCACGLSLGRDHNAARNVLRLGMSLVAVGAEGK